MALPSTVSEKSFSSALDEFTAALGSARVLTAAAELREFRDPFQFATWDENAASAVLMPETVEEVQEVVRVAGRHGVPLWTHSTGRNNGYGGPAPRVGGSVIVSLRNMNRVLEIDEESAYAVVEPGVRWFDLYEAIKAGGHRLMLSIADLGWGSVIGNTLDHGVTYMPYGVDMSAACGMEVVLADGSLLRTGMGAMPGNKAWHLYKRGLGPTLDQLFMQSNFGIVTKMGVWLMPYPEVYMPLWLRVWRDDDLAAVIDTLRVLMLDGTIRMVPQLMNTVLLGSVLSHRDQWYDGDGPLPDAVIDRMARELEIGRWIMRFALYGDEPVLDHRFEKIKRAFEQIEGAEVWGTKVAPAGHPLARASRRAHPGRRAEPRLEQHDRLVRRRGGRPHRLLAGRAADRPRRDRAARPAAQQGRGRRARLHRRAAAGQRAQLRAHHDGDLRHQERGAGAQRLRRLERARPRRRGARLRRVPRAPGLHGPRRRAVLLRRPRLPALLRDDQGRRRPRRDPLARQAGDLAGVDAGRR